jgi:molybdenum cofactor cytidylyltransferase
VAEAALASPASPVIVVVGHRAGDVKAALSDLPLDFIENPHFADGLSSSLNAGLAGCPKTAEGAVILLGDMPLVRPDLIAGLIAAWDGAASAVVPVSEGRRGNPVLLARTLFGEVSALRGDGGAGAFLRTRGDVLEWRVDEAAVLADVDTPEALAGLR